MDFRASSTFFCRWSLSRRICFRRWSSAVVPSLGVYCFCTSFFGDGHLPRFRIVERTTLWNSKSEKFKKNLHGDTLLWVFRRIREKAREIRRVTPLAQVITIPCSYASINSSSSKRSHTFWTSSRFRWVIVFAWIF